MTPFFKTSFKKFIFCIIGLSLVLSFPFIIDRVINSSYIKGKLSFFILEKTGTKIDPSKFLLTVFPRPSLVIDNFIFKPAYGIKINIDSLKLNLDIQTLLTGKINIEQISIDHPQIITNIVPNNSKEKQSNLPLDFSVSKLISQLSPGIKKIFALLPEHQESVSLTIKNVTSPYFNRLDGSLYLSRETQEFSLSANIKDIAFNPSIISGTVFEKKFDLQSIRLDQLECTIKFNSKGSINGLCKLTGPELKSKNNQILFDSNILEISFELNDDFYQININPFESNYPKGTVGVYFTNQEKINTLEFIGTNINIAQAKEMSLLLFKDNEVVKTIFQILLKGVAPKIIVSFQSDDLKDLFNENNFKLKGKIKNGSVHIPQTDLIASRVSGNASINKGVLDINVDKAMIQSSKIKKGILSIDLLNYIDFPFNGEFLLDLDLSMIPQTLISLLPDTFLAKELSLVNDVTGKAKAKLKLSMETRSNDLDVRINTEDFAVSGRYERVPGDIALEKVNFTYEPDRVYLTRIKGTINNSLIYDLNGNLDFKNETIINIQSGSGVIDIDSMIPWLMTHNKSKNLLSAIKDGNGKIHISSMELNGPMFHPDKWEYDLKGMGKKINFTTIKNQTPMENLSCQYHITNEFLTFKNIKTKIKNLSWFDSFIDQKYLDSILVPFDITNASFQIRANNCFFNSNLKFTTGPELNLDLKGKTPSLLTLNSIKFVDKGFSNGSVTLNQNKDQSLYNFKGILNTATLNKLIIPQSFLAKRIHDITQGQPIVIYTDKNSIINITAKHIDLDLLMSQSKDSEKDYRLLPDNLINLKADTIKIKKLTLTDFDSKLSLKNDHIYARLKKADLCDLGTSGYINLKQDIVHTNFSFKAHNKDNIQNVLTCLLPGKFMDGQYSLTCDIEAKGNKKDILNKFAGSIIFNAQKGRIYKLTLISRILSVLNVSNFFKGTIPDVTQKGFAYHSVSIEADIKDSIIYLNKAVIDGHDMTLIFSGWIDPVNDEIDLICLVAPFKTVDLVIKHIPVINTLLGGRLVSVPIEATGKLSDPKVVPLHPSAVGKSLINMMADILNTPVKLWDEFQND